VDAAVFAEIWLIKFFAELAFMDNIFEAVMESLNVVLCHKHVERLIARNVNIAKSKKEQTLKKWK